MPLDWLNTPVDVPISELIARKKRARLIEELRAQLQGRLAPGVQVRLQLADLLVQAGRGAEAVPVLIGLADEFAADGFVAKAIAILKRVEKVHGASPEVASRLAGLVQQQQRAARGAGGGGPARRPVEIGMEEFAAEDPLKAAEAFDHDTEPLPAELAGPPPSAAPAEPQEADPPPAAAVEPADAPTGEDGESGVGQRIRGVFRRFLASLPTAGEEATPLEEALEEAPPLEDERPAEPDLVIAPEDIQPVADAPAAVAPPPVPDPALEPPPLPPPTRDAAPAPAAAMTAPAPEREPEPEIPIEIQFPRPQPLPPDDPLTVDEITLEPEPAELSEQAYEAELLDIVEEVLQQPPPPAAEAPAGMARPAVVEYARRLLATPLLSPLAEEELLAVVRGLRVHTFEPGDVVMTEREPGQGLFIVTSGRVKVFVRNPAGRNFVVARLGDGDFFGEISSLSGRPRTATVVAAAHTDLLELDKPTLDGIARSHPRVKEVLESAYIERASSPEAAAIRAVPVTDPFSDRRATSILEAHFGESRWDPRMRLRLADVLLRAGKERDALPILVGLADDLSRRGYPEKAIAILKKIEKLQRRQIEEVNLAPRPAARVAKTRPVAVIAPPATAPTPKRARTDDNFHGWLLDTVRHAVVRARSGDEEGGPAVRGYGPGLRASPLFSGFSEDELLALIQALRLLSFGPGDVIVTEGEPGQSVFILAAGTVKVFVRNPQGHDVGVSTLGEGSFFGEMSTLSGKPRSATVTAAAPCDLLELDRETLDRLAASHPNVRTVLEEFSRRRAADPAAAAARGRPAP